MQTQYFRVSLADELHPAATCGYRTVAARVGWKWVKAIDANLLNYRQWKRIHRVTWDTINKVEVPKPRYVKGKRS